METESGRFNRTMPPLKCSVRARKAVQRCVGLLIALFIARTWIVDGLPVPCRVTGGSMATTLLGQHYAILCADCGYSFACEAGPLDGYRAICPSCGWPNSVENDSLELSGDHVLIDKSAYLFRRPQRWEVVAFRRPTQGGAAAVKRVVGLPGELIQLRDGDVFVDGQIQRKSLAQQRAMRVLIHDANFSPQAKSKPLPRWHNETKKGGWQSADGRFSHPAASSDGPIDWLVYRHWQRLDEQGDVMFHPVTDLCSYNVGWPRREEDVYAVADVMLSFRVVEATGPGRIWLKATDGDNEFLAEIDPVGRRYSVMLNGHAVSAATDALPRSLDGALIEVSLFDRQFLLAVDGQPLVQLPYQRSGKASLPAAPLAIGTQGAGPDCRGFARVPRRVLCRAGREEGPEPARWRSPGPGSLLRSGRQ